MAKKQTSPALRKIREKLYKKGGRIMAKVVPEIDTLVKNQIELLAGNEAQIKNSTTFFRGLQQILQRYSDLRDQLEESQKTLRQVSQFQEQIIRFQERALVHTDDYRFLNPEIDLFDHLASFLPNRIAIDVGAHLGNMAEELLSSGYEVYAFEPHPEIFKKLKKRLGDRPGFHASNIAIGAGENEKALHLVKFVSGDASQQEPTLYSSFLRHGLPDNMAFTDSLKTKVIDLETLHRQGKLPAKASLLKIDTEGFELEVIKGMGAQRYPVVMAEFWDEKIPFGQGEVLNRLPDMVQAMRQRDYRWHLVLYRLWTSNETLFYCNYARAVENSWGNVFFFQDREVFEEARRWAASTLLQARFVFP